MKAFQEILYSTDCQVFHGMESECVLNAIPKIKCQIFIIDQL